MRRYTVLVSFDAESDSDAAIAVNDLRNAAEDLTSWDFNVREFTLKDEGAAPGDEEPTKKTSDYLQVWPPDEHAEHWTVTGSVTQLLNDRVTEAGRQALCEKYGEDSGNYIAQEVLREQQKKGLWEGVRFDSEHGQFFAYTKTDVQAWELVAFLVGLSWTTA